MTAPDGWWKQSNQIFIIIALETTPVSTLQVLVWFRQGFIHTPRNQWWSLEQENVSGDFKLVLRAWFVNTGLDQGITKN
jgi:hypothetical protein